MNLSPKEIGVVIGFLLVLLAAVMNGAYAIPMRFMSRWKWENIWLLWTEFDHCAALNATHSSLETPNQ